MYYSSIDEVWGEQFNILDNIHSKNNENDYDNIELFNKIIPENIHNENNIKTSNENPKNEYVDESSDEIIDNFKEKPIDEYVNNKKTEDSVKENIKILEKERKRKIKKLNKLQKKEKLINKLNKIQKNKNKNNLNTIFQNMTLNDYVIIGLFLLLLLNNIK